MDQLLSVEMAALRLGLKPITVRAWIAQRRIAVVRLGRRVLVPESEVTRLIKGNFVPALPARS
jgi:excisionase family DNA binding protein